MTKYEENLVSYNGGNKSIFYLAAGPKSGPLIIFMHGWPGIGRVWHRQLDAFASLGFRAIAPDMPGYGRSTARHVQSDYALGNIIPGMLAVLADAGHDQAVWVGHDWGSTFLWTLANTHPHVCRAVVGLGIPFGVSELGLNEMLKTVDREIYPEDQYPHGQWSYQVFYEDNFEKVSAFFDKNPRGFLRWLHAKGTPLAVGKPALMGATTVKDGGWIGGQSSPPAPETIPDEHICMDKDTLDELVSAMEKTGFGPADSWYMNSQANREYNLKHTVHDGKLKMPVLFINARYDSVCETVTGKFSRNMRTKCLNLTETIVDAGHWVPSEKPEEMTAAIARFLINEVEDWWPGYWTNGWVKSNSKRE
ncbi:Alpha/Beta hydrolase protein [Mariannaea sp. PMI_226]|nr:Alpha/Beta hydrolase protein [Mariannaea sp. PMI_226]